MTTKGLRLRTLAIAATAPLFLSDAWGQASLAGAEQHAGPRLKVRSLVLSWSTRFEVGVQAGPSLSWLRGNRSIDHSASLLGPTAGLTLQYNFTPHLGVRLGAGHQQKGSSSEVTFADIHGTPIASGTVRSELQYLTVPLMLHGGVGEKFRLSAGVGGYVGVLMAARSRSEGIVLSTSTDDFERLDLGLCASVCGALALNTRVKLSAELRYDKGLINITALPVVNDGSIRTNAVSLLLGCSFSFGNSL